MSENVSKLTERVVKMSDDNSVVKPKFKVGDVVVALESLPNLLTQGKEYIVGNVAYNWQLLLVETDNGNTNELYAWRFKLKEELKVNEVEKELYQSNSDGRVYEVAFKGNYCVVLKNTMTGDESFCTIEQLSIYFHSYTKEMQKQQKKNEDLGVLANVTDEIRKLLDDNYVICHASVNRDTKGLVEVVVMLGESV